MDYYSILGIEKNASASEIKKAFYTQSKVHHPDKGGDEAEFKKINEAYTTLSDPEKRKLYDMYGKDYEQSFNFKRKTEDIHIQYKISLKDLYFGKVEDYDFIRNIVCQTCHGKGTCKDINITCQSCQGKKQTINMVRQGNMIYQTVSPCKNCNGEGVKIDRKDCCETCQGKRCLRERKTIKIDIKKGMQWGQPIHFQGMAHEQPNILTGDLIIILVEIKDEFVRKGNDLLYNMNISLLQALGGKEIILNHLNGEKLILNTKVSPGDTKKLSNYGMPIQDYYGDLYITFQVTFDLSEYQTNEIIKILNPGECLKGLTLEDGVLPEEEHQENTCRQQ